jgi:predicted aspartyl protease
LSLPRLAVLACLAAPSAAFGACAAAPVADVPLSESRSKLLLPVGIEGSPEQIMLDTGAGITAISTETADRLEILHDFDHHFELGGVGGANSVLNIGKIERFDIGPLRLAHMRVPIIEQSMRSDSGAMVAGLLGADILHRFDVDLDIPGGRLTLWRPDACRGGAPSWADAVTPVSIELDDNNHILLPVRVDDITLNGMLDTGAGEFTLTNRAALRAGMSEDALDDAPDVPGTGVNNRAWHGHYHRFGHVQFAGLRFTDVPTGIVPSANIASYDGLGGTDALLGMRLLRHAHLFISYQAHALYLLPVQTHAAE